MPTLSELLGAPPKRQAVIEDCCRVLDLEVADKRGLGGVAIKGAYNLVKGIRPGFVRDVVDHLLDDFLAALDPVYQEAIAEGASPGDYLKRNNERVADALLAVTDARAQQAERPMIKKTYDKLRPTAKTHVAAAAPRLADLLDRHTSAS